MFSGNLQVIPRKYAAKGVTFDPKKKRLEEKAAAMAKMAVTLMAEKMAPGQLSYSNINRYVGAYIPAAEPPPPPCDQGMGRPIGKVQGVGGGGGPAAPAAFIQNKIRSQLCQIIVEE